MARDERSDEFSFAGVGKSIRRKRGAAAGMGTVGTDSTGPSNAEAALKRKREEELKNVESPLIKRILEIEDAEPKDELEDASSARKIRFKLVLMQWTLMAQYIPWVERNLFETSASASGLRDAFTNAWMRLVDYYARRIVESNMRHDDIAFNDILVVLLLVLTLQYNQPITIATLLSWTRRIGDPLPLSKLPREISEIVKTSWKRVFAPEFPLRAWMSISPTCDTLAVRCRSLECVLLPNQPTVIPMDYWKGLISECVGSLRLDRVTPDQDSTWWLHRVGSLIRILKLDKFIHWSGRLQPSYSKIDRKSTHFPNSEPELFIMAVILFVVKLYWGCMDYSFRLDAEPNTTMRRWLKLQVRNLPPQSKEITVMSESESVVRLLSDYGDELKDLRDDELFRDFFSRLHLNNASDPDVSVVSSGTVTERRVLVDFPRVLQPKDYPASRHPIFTDSLPHALRTLLPQETSLKVTEPRKKIPVPEEAKAIKDVNVSEEPLSILDGFEECYPRPFVTLLHEAICVLGRSRETTYETILKCISFIELEYLNTLLSH